MAANITIGSTTIVEIELVDFDGNTFNVADAEALSVQIRQYQRVLDTYVYGTDDELQDGSTASKLYIEITQELSPKFKEGKVYARAIITNTDADFVIDGEQISLPDYHILTAYLELPDDNDDAVTTIEHYRGFYDASVNLAPSSGGAGTGGAILGGDWWSINVAGTIFGIPVNVGDTITSLVNNPGQTQAYWSLQGSMI